jgi:2-polyprenyl-6-hydroxyphenyl methylase/3-demethylubiquinone-9 3-methyltransferase
MTEQMSTRQDNVDPAEVGKFNDLASRWWDPEGEFKPLHQMNPLRLAYIDQRAPLAGKRCLDIGCGGGILSEAMARTAESVTGIDFAGAALEVARLHLKVSALENVRYLETPADTLADAEPAVYDVVTCL